MKKFPKLNEFEIDTGVCDGFRKFLKLNPQLERLSGTLQLNDAHISDIVAHLSNLKALCLISKLSPPTRQTEEGLLKLTKLKELKELKQSNFDTYQEFLVPLMKAFANTSVCLERVSLKRFDINRFC